ncbi:MAG: Lrp/AsnC family transcriptional regulator [archaeon]
MAELDEKDLKIMEVLKNNSRLSSQQISKTTAIPITTVHNRIKKLEKSGIIRKYTVVFDNKKLGKNLSAYILTTVDYAGLKKEKMFQDELARRIRNLPLVEQVSILAGQVDLLIRVSTSDINALNRFIIRELRNIPGIDRTQTLIVLEDLADN